MTIRKRLEWKTLLTYVHRWMGILAGVFFVVWFVSGIAMMYVRLPVLSVDERLGHVPPLDLSTARVSPAEAAKAHALTADDLRIEMYYDSRPIYRFGRVKVYADTGERVPQVSQAQALEMIRRWVPPAYAGTVAYDTYLLDSDLWTLYREQRSTMPVHRITVGDPARTVYYVSETMGEPVMKTDWLSRSLGFISGVLHFIYIPAFRRQDAPWRWVVAWGSIAGAVMSLLGLVVGIVRLRIKQRQPRPGTSYSPYSGWMKWHHFSGLIVGVFSITWAFSGAMSLGRPFPSMRNQPPTTAQQMAIPGTPLDMDALTMPRLRTALGVFQESFAPKVLQVHQFRGEPYLIASAPPAPWSYDKEIGAQERRYQPAAPHRIVSAVAPERGAFDRFEDERMWEVAKAAMPEAPAQDAEWLQDYDSYYYDRNRALPLPVLRVRYSDAARTWLYLDPSLGTMTKQDSGGRWNRWLYHGLHSLDFPWFRFQRPLWDVVVILLSIGGTVLSATTLVPAWRRLARHARQAKLARDRPREGHVSVSRTES